MPITAHEAQKLMDNSLKEEATRRSESFREYLESGFEEQIKRDAGMGKGSSLFRRDAGFPFPDKYLKELSDYALALGFAVDYCKFDVPGTFDHVRVIWSISEGNKCQ